MYVLVRYKMIHFGSDQADGDQSIYQKTWRPWKSTHFVIENDAIILDACYRNRLYSVRRKMQNTRWDVRTTSLDRSQSVRNGIKYFRDNGLSSRIDINITEWNLGPAWSHLKGSSSCCGLLFVAYPWLSCTGKRRELMSSGNAWSWWITLFAKINNERPLLATSFCTLASPAGLIDTL